MTDPNASGRSLRQALNKAVIKVSAALIDENLEGRDPRAVVIALAAARLLGGASAACEALLPGDHDVVAFVARVCDDESGEHWTCNKEEHPALDGPSARAWWLAEVAELAMGAPTQEGKRPAQQGIVYTPRRLAKACANTVLTARTQILIAAANNNEGVNAKARILPTVLDPCCGAGSLLLATFDALIDAGTSPTEALGALYGIDANPLAVRTTQLVLALASETAFGEGAHVRSGDGLMPADSELGESYRSALGRRTYDIVISNPPYVRASRRESKRLRGLFSTASGAFDLYIPFMEQGLGLLTPQGAALFITSNKFLATDYGGRMRALLRRFGTLRLVLDLTEDRPFEAQIDPCVILSSAADTPSRAIVVARAERRVPELEASMQHLLGLVGQGESHTEGLVAEWGAALPWLHDTDDAPWPMALLGEARRVAARMYGRGPLLGDIAPVRTGVMGFDYRAVVETLAEDESHPVVTLESQCSPTAGETKGEQSRPDSLEKAPSTTIVEMPPRQALQHVLDFELKPGVSAKTHPDDGEERSPFPFEENVTHDQPAIGARSNFRHLHPITTSLVGEGVELWGARSVKLGGKTLHRPVFARAAEVLSDETWRWFSSSKVVVAGIARELRAFVDEEGRCAPLVAVHAIGVDPTLGHALVALMMSSAVRWLVRMEQSGVRIPRGSRRFSVRTLRALPLPAGRHTLCEALSALGAALTHAPNDPLVRSRIDNVVDELYGLDAADRAVIYAAP